MWVWGWAVWAHNLGCTPEDVIGALAGAKAKGSLRGGEAQGIAKLVNDPNVPVEVIAGRLGRYKDRLGLSDEQLTLVAGQLRAQAGELRLPGQPGNLPHILTPAADAPVGRVYLVNGQRPIPVDLSDPMWTPALRQQLEAAGQIHTNGNAPGIYILRHPETGQLYKVGKNENLIGGRFGEYESWPGHGVPVTADVYPLRLTGHALEHAENNLRHFIHQDGWGRLQSDLKWRRPSPPTVRISSEG